MEYLTPGSYWHQTTPRGTEYPALSGDREAEVAIIGAGITGLTAAVLLQQAGREVVLLEAGRVGAGTSGGTSAHLDPMPDQGAQTLIKRFGPETARNITAGRLSAIDRIESWSRQFGADCDFRRVPAFMYSESADGAKALQKEMQAARELGLEVESVAETPLPFVDHGGFRIAGCGRFHAIRYLRALAEEFHRQGGLICEQTRALPPEDGSPCVVQTSRGNVFAQDVLVCTHSGFLGISEIDMRIAPYQSYVLAARVSEPVSDGLFWDDDEPYHYTRLAASDDPHVILVGGADHKTGQGGDERDALVQLEEYVRRRFAVETVLYRWSAEFFEPADGLPHIGRVPLTEHLYMAAGYSGTGLTYGTLAGEMLAALLLSGDHPLAEACSPSRVNLLAGAKEFVKENVNVAARYVADRFAGEAVDSLDQIPRGEGRLVHYRGQQCAVYREPEGTLHVLSPVCTHAGCHVRWNEAEQTWDCPCHGGRYAPCGERIYGPPPENLKRADI